jgi:hypothetical protein
MNRSQRFASIGGAALFASSGLINPRPAHSKTPRPYSPEPLNQLVPPTTDHSILSPFFSPKFCESSLILKVPILFDAQPPIISLFSCSSLTNSNFFPENFEIVREEVVIEPIEALKNKSLINSRVANLLLSPLTGKDAGFTDAELKNIPKSLTKTITGEEALKLSGAIERLENKLPPEAIRAAVTIGLFTEGGVQGTIVFLRKIAEIGESVDGFKNIESVKTYFNTDKPYTIAWLQERLKIFDTKEESFLDINDKKSRANWVLQAFYKDIANLPNPPLKYLALSQVLGPENLLALASLGESIGYNSMNQGTQGSKIIGITHSSERRVGQKLTNMTISRIQELMEENKLFAAGRFQIIGSTLKELLRTTNISPEELFNEKNQDWFGVALLLEKRPKLGAYVLGQVPENPDNIKSAILDLAHEFASKPDPVTGQSVYPPPNKVGNGITVLFVGETLRFSHIASLSVAKLYPRVSDYAE